jgi:hypothetical protein
MSVCIFGCGCDVHFVEVRVALRADFPRHVIVAIDHERLAVKLFRRVGEHHGWSLGRFFRVFATCDRRE